MKKIILISMLGIFFILTFLLNNVNAEIVNINVNHNNSTLILKIGNNTYTYDTNTSFASNILHDVAGGQQISSLNFQVVNFSTTEAVISKVIDSEFNDQQSFFMQTVLPSQASIDGNKSAWAYCVSDLNTFKNQFELVNNTERKIWADNYDQCQQTTNYMFIFMGVLIFLVILVTLSRFGWIEMLKEKMNR